MEDTQLDQSSSDSDLSDDSPLQNESDEEEMVDSIDDEEYRQCQSAVDLNPYSLQARLNLIAAEERCHGRGSQESKIARQNAHEAFPLPENFWLEWIKTEKVLYRAERKRAGPDSMETTHKYIQTIHDLVIQCQNDYQSVPIWLYFIEEIKSAYGIGHLTMDDVRQAYEEALDHSSRHFTESPQIWEGYRSFEQNVLDSLESLVANGLPKETFTEQEKRLRKVWFREISIPSIDSLDVYDDYRSWESCRGSKIPNHIKNTFEKTKKIRNARLSYEDKIKVSENHSFESPDYSTHPNWLEYLDWEIKKQNVPRVLSLLERAVSTFPLSVEIWFRFGTFAMQMVIKNNIPKAVSICKRAIRNCYWSGKLWEFYLLALEISGSDSYSSEFDRALQSGIQTPEEIYLIYRANIDCHWRRLDFFSSSDTFDINSNETKQFRIALGKAKKYFGDNQFSEIHRNLCIEALKYDAILRKQPVDPDSWQKLLTKYPDQEDTWKSAIDLCMSTAESLIQCNVGKAREWFKFAFKKIVGWPPTLGDQWRWFERVYGDTETYLDAEWSITRKQTDAMKQFAQTQKTEQRANSRSTNTSNDRKRKRNDTNESLPPSKKQRTEQITLYVKNLPWKKKDSSPMEVETLEAILQERFAVYGIITNIRVPKNEKNRLAGFAFIDFASGENVDAAIELGEIEIEGRTIKIQRASNELRNRIESVNEAKKEGLKKIPNRNNDASNEETITPVAYTDTNTIFVSNLPFKATDNEIRKLFEECDIKEIRLNRNSKNGLLMGFGYIEMQDESSVANALKLDKISFKGRTINVAISIPKKKRTARLAKDRPDARKTKDVAAAATNPAVKQLRKSNLLAPRTLLKKAAIGVVEEKVMETETKKEVKPKSNDDFRKLFQ